MNPLKFTIERQQCSEWCWAAVTAAVCKCYGDDDVTGQCDVARLVLHLSSEDCSDCDCQRDHSSDCNRPQNLASVLDAVEHDRGNPVNGIPTFRFEDVKSDIDAGRPIVVEITLDDPAASGHAVAIYGYTDEGIVSIADPMHPGDHISVRFADFVAGRPSDLHGTWSAAYLTRRRGE